MKTFEMIQEVKTKDNVIDSIMKSNGLYCLVAWPKVGKSFLALQLANSIANNKVFLGYKVKQSPVLYVSTELSETQLKERLDLTGYKFLPNNFFFIEKDQTNKLNIKNDLLLDIKDFSEKYNGRFIIIDMLKGIDYGETVDTNNYNDTSEKIFGKYRELCKKFNLTILVVHHLNKSGNTLGSIGIDGSVDAILTLKDENNNNYTLSINNRDFNDLEINLYKNKNLVFEVVDEDNSELDFNMSVFMRHIIKRKDVVFTPSEIVAELNLQITPTRFGRLLHDNIKRLEQEGIFVNEQRTSSARYYKAIFIDPMTKEND